MSSVDVIMICLKCYKSSSIDIVLASLVFSDNQIFILAKDDEKIIIQIAVKCRII